MKPIFRSLPFFLLCLIGFSLHSYADHNDSSASSTQARAVDNVRIVRSDGRTAVKELTDGGFRSTIIDTDGQSMTYSYTLFDFQSEEGPCTEGKGQLIVTPVKGQNDEVLKAARDLGFTPVRFTAEDEFIGLTYDCTKVTLSQLQKLYFDPSVFHIEPDSKSRVSLD